MTAQVLRRAGCAVEEQVRMPGRLDDPSRLAIGNADVVCMLGLFDERGYRRMQPVAKSLAAKTFAMTILIGLARSLDQVAKPSAEGPIPSLNDLCQAVCSTEHVKHAAPANMADVAAKPPLVTSRVDR